MFGLIFIQDYIALVHSLLAITIPFALFSSYSTRFELNHAVRLSKVTRLFVSASLLPLAINVCSECGIADDKIYVLGDDIKDRVSFGTLVERARRNNFPPINVRRAKRNTLAFLVFSSGTTGLPKGTFVITKPKLHTWSSLSRKAVMISHGNIVFVMQQVITMSNTAGTVRKVTKSYVK